MESRMHTEMRSQEKVIPMVPLLPLHFEPCTLNLSSLHLPSLYLAPCTLHF